MNIENLDKKGESQAFHYYGDLIRKQLLFAGVLLLLAIILDKEFLTFYLIIGVAGVLVFTVLAGLTSPRTRSVIVNIASVSTVMFLIFEYFTINEYIKFENIFSIIFLLRQALAIIFLIILYFSLKTLRGMPSSK